MDPAATLTTRAGLLHARLEWLALAMQPGAQKEDWTRGVFRAEIARLQAQAKSALTGQKADASGWAALNAQAAGCDRVFGEALLWLQATKGEPVSADIMGLAGALVADLAGGLKLPPPPIVPDLAESFSDYVPLIRMRFPAADIWDLPALAHEFGHYAAYRLTVRKTDDIGRSQPLAELIARSIAGQNETEQARRTHVINEIFADIFATYVSGLAFAGSLLLLRSDLALPYTPVGITHPSFAQRARCILYTIDRMSKDPDVDPQAGQVLDWLLSELSSRWQALLAAVPSSNDTGFVPSKVELFQVVETLAKSARYAGWVRTQYSIRHVVGGRKPAEQGTSLPAMDVLNAAWLELMAGSGDATSLNKRALAVWRECGKQQEYST